MLIYVVPGPVAEDSEVNLRSFNISFDNLEILIKTQVIYVTNVHYSHHIIIYLVFYTNHAFQIPRDDVCDDTTINIEITVNSDGVPFSDTVEYMRSGQVYPTSIYLPVGSNFTAEICAVTPVGRGQCIMYEKAFPPTATKGTVC